MVRYVAFLRDINSMGHTPVDMGALRTYFELPGFQNVATYIQTGNVLFETEETDEKLLREQIEARLKEKLGYPVTVLIRMVHELKNVIKNNPFDNIGSDENRNLYVTFLSEYPPYDVRGSLGVYSNDAEDARLVKREVYIHSSNYGKTCFPNSLIEKKLGVAATTRNWMTLNKILEL
jgi:uncharacterized protein (DUF1697 family)